MNSEILLAILSYLGGIFLILLVLSALRSRPSAQFPTVVPAQESSPARPSPDSRAGAEPACGTTREEALEAH